jgi:hypothetical protein
MYAGELVFAQPTEHLPLPVLRQSVQRYGGHHKVKSFTCLDLLFQWIKQHLRIKAFFGTSENAVKSQIWIAVATYVLVAILEKRLNIDASLYTLLQLMSLTLFERTPINQLVIDQGCDPQDSLEHNQLTLFD